MSQFKTLLKNDIRVMFNFNAYSKNQKKRNTKKRSNFAILAIIVVALLIMSFSYNGMITGLSKTAEMRYTGLYFGMGLGIIICVVMTIANAYSSLFKTKDFELLVAMPIPIRTIILSKFTAYAIAGYASFSLFFIPAVAMNVFFFGIDLLILVYCLFVLLLAPMLILVLCSFISYLFNSLISKFKYQKAVKTILGIIFFIVYFVAIMSFSMLQSAETIEDPVGLCMNIENIFSKIYLPSIWIVKAMNGEFLYFLAFIAISIIPFALFIFYISKIFVKANLASRRVYKNKNFKLVEQKSVSARRALFKKEFKTLFSSSTYLMNCIVGPLISIIISVLFSSLLGSLEDSTGASAIPQGLLVMITLVSTSYMMGMVPTTACSINFEGKRLWIIKSAPIETKQILNTKIFVFTVLTLPFIIINGVIINVFFELNILVRILVFIVPFIITNIFGIEGMLVNTKSYRLNWNTEAEAIKQGTNVLWSLLVSLLISIFLYLPAILFTVLFNITVGMIVLGLLAIVACALFYMITMRHGTVSFDKIPG